MHNLVKRLAGQSKGGRRALYLRSYIDAELSYESDSVSLSAIDGEVSINTELCLLRQE